MSHTPESYKAIVDQLHPISPAQHFFEVERRGAEKKLGGFVSNPGVEYGSVQPSDDLTEITLDHFVTTKKLYGEARTLNRLTLVEAREFALSSRDTQRFIGRIALNERGLAILNPSKMQLAGYMETTAYGAELAAEGVGAYLNGSDELITQPRLMRAIESDISRARQSQAG